MGLQVRGAGASDFPGGRKALRAAAQSGAQISMSVTLKPSTMLSMLRMKVSSFE